MRATRTARSEGKPGVGLGLLGAPFSASAGPASAVARAPHPATTGAATYPVRSSIPRALVVGTTPDYVDLLERAHPGRCLFLTDRELRAAAREPAPPSGGEIICSLADAGAVRGAVAAHLRRHRMRLDGIACFDCESMPLAAALGKELGLDYPSAATIAGVRNKHAATRRWRQVGLPSPRAALVGSEAQLAAFCRRIEGPVVLKPVSGSGSELVFACHNRAEARDAFGILRSRLACHAAARMYAPFGCGEQGIDPRRVFVAEELIEGVELSCDFVVEDGGARIIRVCRKIARAGEPLGTVNAYVIAPQLPEGVTLDGLGSQLAAAAAALGVVRAICVVDIVVRDREMVMLELAPRPAGDCLPALIRASSGLDILGLALDFAAGGSPPIPDAGERLVALRLLATAAGTIRRLDASVLRADPRVHELHLERRAGDHVLLPPESCDRRLLGHAIFAPRAGVSIERQCEELRAGLVVDIDPVGREAARES